MIRFQADKLKHIAVGLPVACVAYAVTRDPWLTVGITAAVATVKEAYDATGRGHVELRDWLATIIPAGVPTIYHLNAPAIWAFIGGL